MRRHNALPSAIGAPLSPEAAQIISVIAEQPIGCTRYMLDNIHTAIRPLAEVEKDAICTAMILCRGNRDKAAKCLKIGRATLYRKLAAYQKDEKQS